MPTVVSNVIEQLPPTSEGRVVEIGRHDPGARYPFYVACWNGDEDQTAHWYKEYDDEETARQEFESWRQQRSEFTASNLRDI